MAKWCTLAPLFYSASSDRLNLPFSFDGVSLGKSPAWLTHEEFTRDLTPTQQYRLKEQTELVLSVEYEADSLGDPDPDWKEGKARSKQDRAFELIQFGNLALWIAKPTSLAFDSIIDADCNNQQWTRVRYGKIPELKAHFRDSGNALQQEDLDSARHLFASLIKLPRNATIWVAVRTLWAALRQEEWTIRYPLLWIGLEGLFGPIDGREINYRLSNRIAFFLSHSRNEAKETAPKARKGYDWRSRVVHGMRLNKLTPVEA